MLSASLSKRKYSCFLKLTLLFFLPITQHTPSTSISTTVQLGFMLLEVGTVRFSDSKNTLVRCFMNSCVAALFYWGFGYAFAFGESLSQDSKRTAGFIGDTLYFYSGNPDNLQANFAGYAHMFFNFAVASVASSIAVGAMAERTSMIAYFVITAFLVSFVFPVVSHWVWSTPGFLSGWHEFKGESDLYMDVGAVDFGGAGVVHLVGATAAAWGCWWVGARRGRFNIENKPQRMANHSINMQMMGAFLIWIGWFALNSGAVFSLGSTSTAVIAGRVAFTTTISAASGAVTSLFYTYFTSGEYNINDTIAGAMGGLVSISSGCATIPVWAAVVTGTVSVPVVHLGSWLIAHICRIDDVTNAVAVHGWCGIWGCVATGLFSREAEMLEVFKSVEVGAFYGGSNLLAANIAFVCITVTWVSGWMCTFFAVMHYAGLLRMSEKEESKLLAGVQLAADANAYSTAAEPELVEEEVDIADLYQSSKGMIGAASIDPRV